MKKIILIFTISLSSLAIYSCSKVGAEAKSAVECVCGCIECACDAGCICKCND